jgi:glycosyltransferase involved in cell wall biosynthesis
MRIAVMMRHATEDGGTGTYTRELVQRLLRQGSDVDFDLLLDDPAHMGEWDGYANARPVVLKANGRLAWDQWAVPTYCNAAKVDVIFNPKHSMPMLATAPCVFVLHGADWFVVPENYGRGLRAYQAVALPLYLRKAAYTISVSEESRQRLIARYPFCGACSGTVHHGVSPRFAPVTDRRHLEEVRMRYALPERFVLYLGLIYRQKNAAGLLEAFRQLLPSIPHDLVLAGRPAFGGERDLGLLNDPALAERVHRPGWIAEEDLPALLSLAELFAFPSHYEGFGIPLLEAMACGTPVVTSTGGACPEVVGDAALTADPADPGMIARAMHQVLTDPFLAQELSRRGIERATLFNWETAAARTLTVLSAVGRHRAPDLSPPPGLAPSMPPRPMVPVRDTRIAFPASS